MIQQIESTTPQTYTGLYVYIETPENFIIYIRIKYSSHKVVIIYKKKKEKKALQI